MVTLIECQEILCCIMGYNTKYYVKIPVFITCFAIHTYEFYKLGLSLKITDETLRLKVLSLKNFDLYLDL